jgi:hypothetical protein
MNRPAKLPGLPFGQFQAAKKMFLVNLANTMVRFTEISHKGFGTSLSEAFTGNDASINA